MKLFQSFSAKLFAIMLGLFLLFCAISTFSWYISFTQEAAETAEENIGAVINSLQTNFEANLRDIDYVTALVSNKVHTSSNDCLIRYLTTADSQTADLVVDLQESQKYLNNRCSFKTYLNGLAVYGLDGRSCSYGITTPYAEVANQDWYGQIIQGEASVVYVPPHDYTQSQPSPMGSQVFSIVRPVFQNNGRIIGLVKADIKCKLLDTIFDIHSISDYELYVIDNNTAELIYAPEEMAAFSVPHISENITAANGSFHDTINGAEYLAVYVQSSVTPWTVVGIVEQNTIISGFIQVRKQMLITVSICILLFIFSAAHVTRFLTRDLRLLTNAVTQVDDENLNFHLKIKSRDEIGTLYAQIGFMLGRIRDLISDIRRKEAEKRQAEIQMLSMQINPHFMYNTLHTIKVLASMQGVQNIATVSDALSNMLHLNLDSREFISVDEEQSYLLDYIHIQEYRYVGKFTYHVSVEDSVRGYMIPKLLIQPVVENALKHGISAATKEEVLYIHIFDDDGKLKISVKNSGEPFKDSLLDGTHYQSKNSSRIGLSNIIRRLNLLFGEEGALRIYSDAGLFTTVEISLPLIQPEEVFQYDQSDDRGR